MRRSRAVDESIHPVAKPSGGTARRSACDSVVVFSSLKPKAPPPPADAMRAVTHESISAATASLPLPPNSDADMPALSDQSAARGSWRSQLQELVHALSEGPRPLSLVPMPRPLS